jgi:hypothetical protein
MADGPLLSALKTVRVDAPKQSMIVAPQVMAKRCGNCKHQTILGPPFGDTPLCTEEPPKVHVVVQAYGMVPPTGRPGDPFEHGGMKAVGISNEVRYPPAPDNFTCSKWVPRLANALGEAVK